MIGYSTFSVAPGQITEICKLDDAGQNLGMCFNTSATTCPGPGNCQITASLYETITTADLTARKTGSKFRNIGMGENNDIKDIKVQLKVDEDPPAGSELVGSTNTASPVSLEGLLLGPPAPGLLTNGGSSLLEYGGTRFTAAQFARSLELVGSGYIGEDGVTLLGRANLVGNDGATLIGNDGGTIMNRSEAGSFNYNNALNFITRLIGNDGGTALHLAELIGIDGGTLIGLDGSTLIGLDGSTLQKTFSAGGSLLGNVGMVAAGAGNLTANLQNNPSQFLGNLHGVSFVSHNGADILSHNGGQILSQSGANTKSIVQCKRRDGQRWDHCGRSRLWLDRNQQ